MREGKKEGRMNEGRGMKKEEEEIYERKSERGRMRGDTRGRREGGNKGRKEGRNNI